MDDKKHYFKLEASARLLFIVSYRQSIACNFECITSINLFTSTFLVSDSPLYKRLIKAGLNDSQIQEVAISILNENLPLCSYQKTYTTLRIEKDSYAISEEVYCILLTAEEIAKNYYNKNTIGYNEIIAACTVCIPVAYELFLKECNIYPNPNNNLLKEEVTMKIPANLNGCLTILNSKFSPDEKECAILGRDEETKALTRILAKDTKRNAVFVGEAGVGKTAIVEKFTWLIVTKNCPDKFKDYIVVSLDVNSIIAGTQFRGSAEERFKYLIDFLDENPKCILFVDEIHTLLGAGACRDGDLDLANALKPILARNTTQVIGATTLEEYNQYFSKDSALKRRFEPIMVKEPKIHEVYPMIQNQIKRLTKSHGVTISKDIVDMVIFYASCFNKETKNPDRTLDLIDRAMATAELAGKSTVEREDVLENFDLNYKIFKNTPENIKIGLAYHEAGHYLVHRFSDELYNYKTTALSIMPAENYYGAHVYDIDEDVIASRTLRYHIQLIGCKLAGRVAEKMYSNTLSAGASSDLENATLIASDAITKYGLTETFTQNRIYSFNQNSLPLTREKNIQIDNEVDFLLEKGRMYAKYILKTHNKELQMLVNTLLEKRMMSGEELDELF